MIDGGRAGRGGMAGGVLALAGTLGLLLSAAGGCDDPLGAVSPGGKAFGEACASGDECASSVCAVVGGVGGTCSKSCLVDRECGENYVCRAREDHPGSVCSKPVGLALGAACLTAAQCQHGRCLHRAGALDQPGFCSAYCEGAGDCPAGLKACEEISDSAGRRMCLPGEGEPGAAAPGPKAKALELEGGKAAIDHP
ncbi:hypothetical protein [Sorangium sp. So ce1000]|uniref:hypothetical protein n=1 Tax=Sorangium sp. So ce1000 TaxID=3133325 RepID=UPI003F5FDEDB